MHRVDFRSSSRRARADWARAESIGASSSSSSSSTRSRRRSLSFGGHRRRVSSSNSNNNSSKAATNDENSGKPSRLRHLNIPLQRKGALTTKTASLSKCHNRPPLAKIDEQYEETNSIVTETSGHNNHNIKTNIHYEGAFPLTRETHMRSQEVEIEPRRTHSSKTRMDSVRVGETEDGSDVFLVQFPNEEAVEIVSLSLDSDDQSNDKQQQQQCLRQEPPEEEDEEPLFVNFEGERMARHQHQQQQEHHNLNDISMDTTSVRMLDPGDKYSVQLFEESSVCDGDNGFDDGLSAMTPLTGPPPAPSIQRSYLSELSGFSPVILVPHNRCQSKNLYLSNSPASVLGQLSHHEQSRRNGGCSIQSNSVIHEDEDHDGDESHYYDENRSTVDSYAHSQAYSQATGSTVPFSQASTVAHQNSKNLVGRSPASADRRMFLMDDAMSVDIDVLKYMDDKYAMPRSSSTASASVYTDASSVYTDATGLMTTRSWQSSLTSVMPGLDKPLNISLTDEFHDMGKEAYKNPSAFTKWLNPL